MSALSIQPTFPIFTGTDGLPLENGYIWIGTANLDPQGNPISVYWDAALTIPAGQPIRTLNGYPSRSGTPARIYVNSDYSIRVQDSKGSLVYSAPQATERISSDLVTYQPPFTGGVAIDLQDKLAQTVSVKDFGAVGDGVTDDTAAIQAALDYTLSQTQAGKNISVYAPVGVYKCGQLNFNPITSKGSGRIKLYGEYGASIFLSTINNTTTPFFNIGKYGAYGAGGDWEIDGIYFKSQNLKKGIGLFFEALAWQPTIKNCIFENFFVNLEARSCITMILQNCRLMGADVSFAQYVATTGDPALDQLPANTRILYCYFGGQGDGSNPNRLGIFGNGGAGGGMGYNCIVDACVFEGNTDAGIANLAPTSVVSNSWFEKSTDVISGELFNVCVMNNFTVYPLFVAFGNTLLPSNRNILLNNGVDQVNPPYGNLYPNILNRIKSNYIELTNNVFCGVDSNGFVTPSVGQGQFQADGPQIYVRNLGATLGRHWYFNATSSNNLEIYNHTNTGVYIVNGGTAWIANSDERLKDIIEPIDHAVSKVAKLRSVIGKYKTDEEGTRRAFLIAQDVKAVFPEAVSQNSNSQENYLGVAYSDVIPLLVSAIKELAEEIKALKNA
jgi:hypothetical protein